MTRIPRATPFAKGRRISTVARRREGGAGDMESFGDRALLEVGSHPAAGARLVVVHPRHTLATRTAHEPALKSSVNGSGAAARLHASRNRSGEDLLVRSELGRPSLRRDDSRFDVSYEPVDHGAEHAGDDQRTDDAKRRKEPARPHPAAGLLDCGRRGCGALGLTIVLPAYVSAAATRCGEGPRRARGTSRIARLATSPSPWR